MTAPRAAPTELAWLVDVIGEDATLRLIEGAGGTRVQIPAKITSDCPLAVLVGDDAARKMTCAFGMARIKVPLARGKWPGAWRASVYRARGITIPQIARRMGVVEDTVRVMLQPRATERQLDLLLVAPEQKVA